MTRYVLGFAFGWNSSRVALILKDHPEWQAGKYNGIGGRIEDGESPVAAMAREFEEETGAIVDGWRAVCTLRGSDFEVYVFAASAHLEDLRSPTSETVRVWHPCALPDNCIPNLRWLVPMCLDREPLGATIEYK